MQPDTLSLNLAEVMPVAGLHVEVTEGPDAGATCDAPDRMTIGTADGNHLVVTDPTVSRFHVELRASEDGVVVTDHASTNGTRIGAARVERAIVDLGSTLVIGRTSLRVTDGRRGIVDLHHEDRLGEVRGRSTAMRRLMATVKKVAASEVAVLLVGDTGTGKELIARAVHDASKRAGKPFVTVDCGALAPNLFASQLFGHEKGAFTGADRQRPGAFEVGDGGTVFLDEIGEMPPDLQSHLLGVLERRRFRRVGGHEEIATDVRIVAATNRDLREEVNSGRFRLDLFYRIAAARIDVPPLRERTEDIPLLVEHFLREAGHDGPVQQVFPPARLEELARHSWPGNVRELRNLVETTLAMGESISFDAEIATSSSPDEHLTYRDARAKVLHEFEHRYLSKLIERAGGNVSRAARLAKMDRSHLFDLLRRHDLR